MYRKLCNISLRYTSAYVEYAGKPRGKLLCFRLNFGRGRSRTQYCMHVYGASVWQSPRFGAQLHVHERSPISVNGERHRDLHVLAVGSLSFGDQQSLHSPYSPHQLCLEVAVIVTYPSSLVYVCLLSATCLQLVRERDVSTCAVIIPFLSVTDIYTYIHTLAQISTPRCTIPCLASHSAIISHLPL